MSHGAVTSVAIDRGDVHDAARQGVDHGRAPARARCRDYDGVASYAMAGAGDNRVAVLPELETVIVVTAENFGRRAQHGLTDAPIPELIR